MSRIISEELGSANNIFSNLVKDNNAQIANIIAAINAFKDNSKEHLEGEAWNQVINTLVDTYVPALNKIRDANDIFLRSINDANNKMSSYIDAFEGPEKDLDNDGKTYQQYQQLRDENKNYEEVQKYTDKKTKKEKYTNVVNQDKKAKYELAVRCLKYLDNLPSADNSAFAVVESSVDASLDSLKTVL